MERETITIVLSTFKTRFLGFLYACIPTTFKIRVLDRLLAPYERAKLKNINFSIICNNCFAGGIYHKLGLQYSTPTIGLFFFSEDYITFLENFEYFIKLPIKFKVTSLNPTAKELRKIKYYPVGILGNKVEIHFLHYADEREAADKWTRRTKRINFDNLFFIYSDADEDFSEEFLLRYQRLPFKHKIFLSSKSRSEGEGIVFVRDYEKKMRVGDLTLNRKYEKYIDLIKWLNGADDFLKK